MNAERSRVSIDQDQVAQLRHENILALATIKNLPRSELNKYRVLVDRSKDAMFLTVDDYTLARLDDGDFREKFMTGNYCDQGNFGDLIEQAHKEIRS